MPDWRKIVRTHLPRARFRGEQDEEIVEELAAHLEEAYREALARGATEEEAQVRALEEVEDWRGLAGAILRERRGAARSTAERRAEAAEERLRRRGRAWNFPAAALEILHLSIRRLRRSPALTAVVVLTLAIGIGATTAIFSVVKGVLLDPLPYEHPEQLVAVWNAAPALGEDLLAQSLAFNAVYEDDAPVFQAVGVWHVQRVPAVVGEVVEELQAVSVTDGLLRALRVQPLFGRNFTAEDIDPRSPRTMMLSYGFWQRRFGGDPNVLGRSFQTFGMPAQIIGVMPPAFRILDENPDVYLPLRYRRADLTVSNFVYPSIGRLQPGVSQERATAELTRLMPLAPERYPGGLTLERLRDVEGAPVLHPLKADFLGDIGNVLWVVLGAVGIILVVACANVANLLLMHAETRRRASAVEAALGCSRLRFAAQSLAEGLMLGILGGVAGVGLAYAGVRLLLRIGPAGLPRLHEVALDPGVLLFAAVVSLVAGALPRLTPLAHGWRLNLTTDLKEGSRWSGTGRAGNRTRNGLVVAQMVLTFVALVASGLMIRTFVALHRENPGFTRGEELLTFRLSIPRADLSEDEDVGAAHEAIARRLEELPGVVAVGLVTSVPMSGGSSWDPLLVEDFPLPEGQQPPIRRFKRVGGGYPEALGDPVLAGRSITWDDIRYRRRVVMITESLARRYWGDPARAVGRRVSTWFEPPDWREIVGVVGNVLDEGVNRGPVDIVYWPMVMEGYEGSALSTREVMAYVIRSPRVGTPGFRDAVQRAVFSMHSTRPLSSMRTMADYRRDSMALTSFTLVLLGITAAVTLLLGVVGIYGVIAYGVGRRTREVGLRIALGADPAAVTAMVLRQGMLLTVGGIGLGLIGAVALTRLMRAVVYGVHTIDLASYACATAVLTGAAWLATYLPARRAARVDPVDALRTE